MTGNAVLMRTLVILGIASLLFLAGCGGSTSQSFNQPPNPSPTITTISPNGALAGSVAFTLTINGTNFVAASLVNFGGTTLGGTFVSAPHLNVAIPTSTTPSASPPAGSGTKPPPA